MTWPCLLICNSRRSLDQANARRCWRRRALACFRATEEERLLAVQLMERGKFPEIVAEILGVSRSSVFDWQKKYREGTAVSRSRVVLGVVGSALPPSCSWVPELNRRVAQAPLVQLWG